MCLGGLGSRIIKYPAFGNSPSAKGYFDALEEHPEAKKAFYAALLDDRPEIPAFLLNRGESDETKHGSGSPAREGPGKKDPANPHRLLRIMWSITRVDSSWKSIQSPVE